MPSKYDRIVLGAIAWAVFSPAIPGLGNPANSSVLILLLVMMAGRRMHELAGLMRGLVLILGLATVATLAGQHLMSGAWEFNVKPFVSFVRILVCYLAVRGLDDPVGLLRPMLAIGCVASVFGVAQFLFPVVSEFTSAYYLASERSAVFDVGATAGGIVRIISVYENPSSVGLLSIVLIILALHLHSRRRISTAAATLGIVINVAAGILSLSKIFFAGIPIVFAAMFAVGYGMVGFTSIAVTAACAVFFFALDSPLVAVVRYGLDAALDPEVALQGRYLAEQQSAISQSFLFGHGFLTPRAVIINDSAYLIVFYLVGLVGSTIFLGYLVWWIARRWRLLPATFYLTVLIVLIAGIGSNTILGFRIDIYLTSLCCMLYHDSRERRKSWSHAYHSHSHVQP